MYFILRVVNRNYYYYYYHGICRTEYRNRAVSAKHETTSKWRSTRRLHAQAFESLTRYIDDIIIQKEQVLSLTYINNHYQTVKDEISDNTFSKTTN